MFRIFTRTWWTRNPAWPMGLEPQPGKKHTIAWADTEQEARDIAIRYNATHDPGPLSKKAEIEEVRAKRGRSHKRLVARTKQWLASF